MYYYLANVDSYIASKGIKLFCNFNIFFIFAIACTLIVSLAEQLSEIHNDTVIEGLDRLCKFLPGMLHSYHFLRISLSYE